jgi:hypothetical protein
VAFNILGPLTNQLSRMSEMNEEDKPKKRRGVAGAVGLGAALSLAAAQQADAATELAQLAASDSRWVPFGGACCGTRYWPMLERASARVGVLVGERVHVRLGVGVGVGVGVRVCVPRCLHV